MEYLERMCRKNFKKKGTVMERVMLTKVIELMFILQWNAKSLLLNGHKFKRFIEELDGKPDVICV